jgi:hypothetical protein
MSFFNNAVSSYQLTLELHDIENIYRRSFATKLYKLQILLKIHKNQAIFLIIFQIDIESGFSSFCCCR